MKFAIKLNCVFFLFPIFKLPFHKTIKYQVGCQGLLGG